MAKKPGERHSAANRDPVTIDLEGEDVTRLGESETGSDGGAAEAAEPTPMAPENGQTGATAERAGEETAIADETAGLSDAEPDSDRVVTTESENGPAVADQTATFDDASAQPEPMAASNEPAEDVRPHESEAISEPPPPPAGRGESRRSGMGPLGAFLLGAVLVALGLGSAVWLGYVPLISGQSGASGAQIAGLQQEIDALRGEMANNDADGGESSVASEDLAALQDQVRQLRDSISSGGAGDAPALKALSDRLEALEAGAPGNAEGDGADTRQALDAAGQQRSELASRLGGLEEELSALRDDLRQATGQRQDAVQQTRQSLSELDERFGTISEDISELQSRVGSLSESVSQLSGRLDQVQQTAEGNRAQENVARAIAASALRSAVAGGRPYRNELETARTLGAGGEPVEALSQYAVSGVATPAELAARVPAVADAMREALAPRTSTATSGGFLDQLTAGARSLVTIRRQGEPAGEGPESAITRFEHAVASGELEKALGEYQSLPPEVQRAGQSFARDLRETVEAEGSLSEVLAAIGQAGRPAPDDASEATRQEQGQPPGAAGGTTPATATEEPITSETEQ